MNRQAALRRAPARLRASGPKPASIASAHVFMLGAMGVVAGVGGALLFATDGLGMDRSELKDSPFDTFLMPGVLLSLIVGGSHSGAAFAAWRRSPFALLASLAAGCILLSWIIVEAVMIERGRGLQAFVLVYTVAEIALSLRSP